MNRSDSLATEHSACRDCILTDCIYQISLFAVWFYFYVGKVFISCFAKKRTKEGDLRRALSCVTPDTKAAPP